MARFWRPEIPFRDKWCHCNDREYRRHVLALNPPDYHKASQHKVIEKALLTLFRLPTPRFIGFFHAHRGQDRDGARLCDEEDLRRLLLSHVDRRLCFKRVEGYGGRGFFALDVREEGGRLYLQHPITAESHSIPAWLQLLSGESDGWLLEEYLHQHPALAAINPSSVNTLRLWVLGNLGRFTACGAFLRVGRAGSQVDNTTQGGLACPIDVPSGKIVEALDLTWARNNHLVHPDTGVQIVGLSIPHWRECLRVAERALAAFPHVHFAGMDLAVTSEGPSVIELNVEPDRRGAAHLDIPHRQLFEPASRPEWKDPVPMRIPNETRNASARSDTSSAAS
jgi:hypothetical protein